MKSGSYMLKTVLIIAAASTALAMAEPAQAATDFATVGLTDAADAMQVDMPAGVIYAHSWVNSEFGKLVVSSDPDTPASSSEGSAVELTPPATVSVAALMPEPTSWTMVAVGLVVIGWLIRGRARDARVSFV